MRMICRYALTPLLTLLLIAASALCASSFSFKVESYILPQPDDTLQTRLGGVKELAEYMKQIETSLEASFRTADNLQATTGAVVVAVKPGRQARSWLMSSEYSIAPAIAKDFQDRFEKIRPVALIEIVLRI